MLLEEIYEFYVQEESKTYKVTRSNTGRLNPLNDYLFKQYISSRLRVDQHPAEVLSDRQEIHFINTRRTLVTLVVSSRELRLIS